MQPEEVGRFQELYGAHYAPIYRFLLARLPNPQDAEDLAQESFLRLLRVAHADLIRQPDAYLFRIAANVLLEFRMRARRSPVAFDSEQANAAVDLMQPVDASAPAEALLDAEDVVRAIESLPVRHRTALVLHRRDGLTYAQIGAKLGVGPDMVKKYLASAIAKCRVALGENR